MICNAQATYRHMSVVIKYCSFKVIKKNNVYMQIIALQETTLHKSEQL